MKIWFPAIQGNSGADVYTRRLADALRRRGHEIEVSWFSGYFQLAPFLLRSVPPPKGTQIIHANSWNGFAFAHEEIPLVVTVHLNVFDPLYAPYKTLAQRLFHGTAVRQCESASFRAASAITTVSEATRLSLTHLSGLSSVRRIYNWVNTQTFCPPNPWTRPACRPFRLLFVGNLSRRKGADLLAPIMRELGTGFELRFTSGLREGKAKYFARNMRPLGIISDESRLVETYRECDAVLFPSRLEGFSQVALEAMACGKPVIAAKVSSLPEIVEDGVTGILCPKDDVLAFAAACRRLAGEPEMLLAYGQAARRRIERLFSEEIILPQYIALNEELVHGKKPSLER